VTEAKIEITDELLVAYVDDQLDDAQRAMVSATLDRDPPLCRRAEEMRLARDLLREAFPLQPAATVPVRILEAEKRLAAACAQHLPRARRAVRVNLKYVVAAAVVLCAVGAATYLAWRAGGERAGALATAVGPIDPGNPLHGLLESTPSAQIVNVTEHDAALRAILTFRAKDGRICREFEIVARSGASTGVACRGDGHWRTEVLLSTAAAPPSSQYYTPAAGSEDAGIDAVVDRLIQGDPLSVEEEAQVLNSARIRAPEIP
jgi:hypothetical protein